MRTKEVIKKDFVRIATGENCYNANKLKLEVLLDIRDLLKRKHGRKLTEQQKKKLKKGLEKYWKKQLRRKSP